MRRSFTEQQRQRGARQWGVALVLTFVLAGSLGACGRPDPTPGSAAAGPSGAPQAAIAARAASAPVQGRLLFVRAGNIWLWSNGQEQQLTNDGASTQPRWSPDGSAFLYVHNGNSFADLWVATDLGRTLRQLTFNQATGYQPETREYVQNSYLLTGPSWAKLADGSDRIVYSTDVGQDSMALWLMNGLRAKPEPVYGTKHLTGHIEGAALSPDGQKVAFTYMLTDPNTYVSTIVIYVVDLTSGTIKELATDPAGQYDPVWSPDGQWIAFASRQGGGTNIWVMRADGSDQHRLTDSGNDRSPVWSPDGSQLAFVHLQGDKWGLYTIDLANTNGSLTASAPQQIGNYSDVDPGSGISWSR